LVGAPWIQNGPSSSTPDITGGATLLATGAAPVPEPSTWAMMLLGLGSLGVLGYRQTRKGQAATT